MTKSTKRWVLFMVFLSSSVVLFVGGCLFANNYIDSFKKQAYKADDTEISKAVKNDLKETSEGSALLESAKKIGIDFASDKIKSEFKEHKKNLNTNQMAFLYGIYKNQRLETTKACLTNSLYEVIKECAIFVLALEVIIMGTSILILRSKDFSKLLAKEIDDMLATVLVTVSAFLLGVNIINSLSYANAEQITLKVALFWPFIMIMITLELFIMHSCSELFDVKV